MCTFQLKQVFICQEVWSLWCREEADRDITLNSVIEHKTLPIGMVRHRCCCTNIYAPIFRFIKPVSDFYSMCCDWIIQIFLRSSNFSFLAWGTWEIIHKVMPMIDSKIMWTLLSFLFVAKVLNITYVCVCVHMYISL